MSKNIEIQINTGSNTYEVLYPKTLGSLVSGAVSSATTANSATSATTATKLSTARSMSVNLGSTSSASFDGSANASLGVSGTLPVSYGGTGVNSYSSLASMLQSYMSSSSQIRFSQYIGTGTINSSYINLQTNDTLIIIFPFNIYTSDSSSSNHLSTIAMPPIGLPLYGSGSRFYMQTPCGGSIARNSETQGYGGGMLEVQYDVQVGVNFRIYLTYIRIIWRSDNSASNDSAVYMQTYSSNALNINGMKYFYAIIKEPS